MGAQVLDTPDLVDFRYIGLSLSEGVRNLLLSEFGPYIPAGWTQRATHHTLVHYGDKGWRELAAGLLPHVGKYVPLSIQYIGSSSDAVALCVSTPFPCSKAFPHITLAFAPNASSVSSNAIKDWISIPPKLIYGTVEVIQ